MALGDRTYAVDEYFFPPIIKLNFQKRSENRTYRAEPYVNVFICGTYTRVKHFTFPNSISSKYQYVLNVVIRLSPFSESWAEGSLLIQ